MDTSLRLTLTGLASQYIHMPLAPWCLKKAVDDALLPITAAIADLNINQTQEELLEAVMATKPDILGLSLYIWNRDCAFHLIRRLKAVHPGLIVIVGGPEATFDVKGVLGSVPADYVLRGAGEESLPLLLSRLIAGESPEGIPGLCYAAGDGIRIVPPAPTPAPRSDIYTDEWRKALNGRMVYAETSRGCPFNCAFCLSGNKEAPDARQVQFMPEEEALQLLIRLGNVGSDTVKLVDRTFNCHKARTMHLIRGLIDAKARGEIGHVCYHFEVAADLFDDETIELLGTAPAGLFQMEAGLQSFHAPTLEACDRRTDMARLTDRIRRLIALGSIHLHIDLIAGLPQEDFVTFGQSFDCAFELRPHQLQLGFLKFIRGSRLRQESWGARFAPDTPYEVLSTPFMTYDELSRLRHAAEAVERIHNSGRFALAEQLALEYTGMRPFDLYLRLGDAMSARPGRWSLDALTAMVHGVFTALGAPQDKLRDAMIIDRLATDNTGYLPPLLQSPPDTVKAAARAWRDAHPEHRHPRIALLTDGQLAVALWQAKDAVTERGLVEVQAR